MSVPMSLQIFYDGSCPICVREMSRYRRNDPDGRFTFVDISTDDFDPARYGKTRDEFMKQVHVWGDEEGVFLTGFDAVIAIWRRLPICSGRRFVAKVAELPGCHWLGRRAYWLLARNRHRLPIR